MKFDDLDKAMRVYEQSLDQCILPDMYLIVRLDGRTFTRLTRDICHFQAPFDDKFRDCMIGTVKHLMDCGFKVIYGYTESDEISLLLSHKSMTFKRKTRKLNSILAGEASAAFSLALGRICSFDSRVVPLPNAERVKDYFLWRQEDAHRNSLNAYCYWKLRDNGYDQEKATYAMNGKSVAEKNEMLWQMQINYNDAPSWQKRGIGFYYRTVVRKGTNKLTGETVDVLRNELVVDYELPLHEEYADFIGKILKLDGCG